MKTKFYIDGEGRACAMPNDQEPKEGVKLYDTYREAQIEEERIKAAKL